MNKPLWTESALPRLGKQLTDDNINNIRQLIDDCLNDNSYEHSRMCVKEETWAHCGEEILLAHVSALNFYLSRRLGFTLLVYIMGYPLFHTG